MCETVADVSEANRPSHGIGEDGECANPSGGLPEDLFAAIEGDSSFDECTETQMGDEKVGDDKDHDR